MQLQSLTPETALGEQLLLPFQKFPVVKPRSDGALLCHQRPDTHQSFIWAFLKPAYILSLVSQFEGAICLWESNCSSPLWEVGAVPGRKPSSVDTACEHLCPDTAWLGRGISFRPFLGDTCLRNCLMQMTRVLPYWMTVQTNCWAWTYLTRAINAHAVQPSSMVKSESTWRDKLWFNPLLGKRNLELNFTNFASSTVLLFF